MKLFLILFLLFSTLVVGNSVDLTHTFCNEQKVDINRFTQLLSNHLLFDHLDKAYMQLSRKISLQFRNAIQVKVKKMKSSSITSTIDKQTVVIPPVDVHILKRQLKGAVGCMYISCICKI